MISYFNDNLAVVLWVSKAVLLQKIHDYRAFLKANWQSQHNWDTRVVMKDSWIKELMPYIKSRTIKKYLQELVDDWYLDVFVSESFDRFNSYCPTQKTIDILKWEWVVVVEHREEIPVEKKIVAVDDEDKWKTNETFELFWKTYPKSRWSKKDEAKKKYIENPLSADEIYTHAMLQKMRVKYWLVQPQYINNRTTWLNRFEWANEVEYTELAKEMWRCMAKKSPIKPEEMRDDVVFLRNYSQNLMLMYRESKDFWTIRLEQEREKNPFK